VLLLHFSFNLLYVQPLLSVYCFDTVRTLKSRFNIKILSGATHRIVLISVSVALSQTSTYDVRLQTWATASRGVPVYASAFVGTECGHPRRDG